MVNYICEKYGEAKLTKKIERGAFTKIIEEAKRKCDVANCSLSIKTVQSRFRRSNLIVSHPGTSSPMAPLEPVMLEIVLQKEQMNQPLTVDEGLRLANSMIKAGSEVEKNVIAYLQSRNQYADPRGSTTRTPGSLLGCGYWAGFRRRHNHVLVSKRGVQFGHNRSEWCKYDNFKVMYDLVYDAMEKSSVVERLLEPEWENEFGEQVQQDKAVGEKVEYHITHLDHILYVDEVGNNTCQKDDGHNGGQKFLVQLGMQSRTACSTSEAHWTTLGFTSGTGKPVLCAIIFAAETLSVEERLGVDIFADCSSDYFSE